GFRAYRQDPLTGSLLSVARPDDPSILRLISRVMSSYGRLSPGRLVEISHARGAPWHFVVDQARLTMAFGLRIPDNVILQRFKFHKVSVGAEPMSGEPS